MTHSEHVNMEFREVTFRSEESYYIPPRKPEGQVRLVGKVGDSEMSMKHRIAPLLTAYGRSRVTQRAS